MSVVKSVPFFEEWHVLSDSHRHQLRVFFSLFSLPSGIICSQVRLGRKDVLCCPCVWGWKAQCQFQQLHMSCDWRLASTPVAKASLQVIDCDSSAMRKLTSSLLWSKGGETTLWLMLSTISFFHSALWLRQFQPPWHVVTASWNKLTCKITPSKFIMVIGLP